MKPLADSTLTTWPWKLQVSVESFRDCKYCGWMKTKHVKLCLWSEKLLYITPTMMHEQAPQIGFYHVHVLTWWWRYSKAQKSASGNHEHPEHISWKSATVIFDLTAKLFVWKQPWLIQCGVIYCVRFPLLLTHCVDNLDGNVLISKALQTTSCRASRHPDWSDIFILPLHLYQNFIKKVTPQEINNIKPSHPHFTDWTWLTSKLYKEMFSSLWKITWHSVGIFLLHLNLSHHLSFSVLSSARRILYNLIHPQ